MNFKVDISALGDSSIGGHGVLVCVEGELDLYTAQQLQGDPEAAIAGGGCF